MKTSIPMKALIVGAALLTAVTGCKVGPTVTETPKSTPALGYNIEGYSAVRVQALQMLSEAGINVGYPLLDFTRLPEGYALKTDDFPQQSGSLAEAPRFFFNQDYSSQDSPPRGLDSRGVVNSLTFPRLDFPLKVGSNLHASYDSQGNKCNLSGSQVVAQTIDGMMGETVPHAIRGTGLSFTLYDENCDGVVDGASFSLRKVVPMRSGSTSVPSKNMNLFTLIAAPTDSPDLQKRLDGIYLGGLYQLGLIGQKH